MGLTIDITRKLPGFKLEMELAFEREIVGILGASGSGKSMLLNSIAGLVRPDKGRIALDDAVYFDASKKINLPPRDRKVGYLFQNYAMFPHLTVEENIAFGLGKLSRDEQRRIVSELLERFHLSDMGRRYPSQLSGGQQQRVALARALAVEPKILLLDEPFSALDEHLKNHMMKDMLESLKHFQGTTLFVTHNMAEAYRLSDRIIVVNNGSVETLGTKQEVFHKPESLLTAKITGCKNVAAAIRKSPRTVEIPAWGILAETEAEITSSEGTVGIRETHIKRAEDHHRANCYPVWISDENEAPFRTTLYLKVGSPPTHSGDYHLQWELDKEERISLTGTSFLIHLDPARLFFMNR